MGFRHFVLAFSLLVLFAGMAPANERRVALVVGVASYKHAPLLANTLNDARSMTDALKRVGFEVEQLLDPDRATFEAGVRNLRQRAQGADASLFYYAGHALELGGRNWLLPAPANIQSDRDLRFEAFDLDSILDQIEGVSRVALVFLDSCRDNPFRVRLATGTREAPTRGLARVSSSAGTFVAFSTAPGTVAQDGTGTNSPFTAALLKRMETAGVELRRLLSLVRGDVRESTQGRQVPWENSALEGDFFFRPPPPAAAAPPQQNDREIVFWSSISASRDPADFRAYLAQFPQGVFAELARNRLAQLQAALAPPPAPASPPATVPPVSAPSSSSTQSAPSAPSSPLRDSLITQLAAAAPEQSQKGRDDTASSYERMGGRKAIAALVGTARNWRMGGYTTAERAEEATLESCQFQFGAPCATVAVDDKVFAAPNGSWTRRDMARVRYEGHFDPGRIPSIRDDVLNRPDVQGYRLAPGPKAAAFHPWGRLFVVSAAGSQSAAEERALAACNADPSRKGADGSCYLYAVGNRVVLTKRYSKPRTPAATLEEAFALAARERNGFQNYNAESNNKAQAVELESGRTFRWHQSPTKEKAERAALEACQLRYGQPCILLALNDELKAPDPFLASPQDMPRIRYAGKFKLDMVPLEWNEKAQSLLKSYESTKKHRAIAIRPSPLRLQFYSGAKSEAEAERQVLERCNTSEETPHPCFLYAVNDQVVLPQRRTEPRQ